MIMTHKSKAIHVASKRLKDKNDSRLSLIMHSQIEIKIGHKQLDRNKLIMQIKKGPVPYGVNNTKMRKELNNKSINQTSEY